MTCSSLHIPGNNRQKVVGDSGFTIIELIVVITMIVLVLAIALPSLGALNADARLTAAYQLINGTLTQAYFLAAADKNMTAVRFLPGGWDSPDAAGAGPSGRQHMVIYRYVGSTDRENPPGSDTFALAFDEYFVRQPGAASVRLPEDVWVAPVDAFSTTAATLDLVLGGDTGKFMADPVATNNGKKLLNADDFTIVVDPQTGLLTGAPGLHRLRAYAPAADSDLPRSYRQTETDGVRDSSGQLVLPYQRLGFSGVVIYRREPFVGLVPEQNKTISETRQDYLRRTGRAYMAQRFGGGLSAALQRPQ